MQYSPDLQNVPKDANRHQRGFSERNKILEMKLKQLRQFWKIPLNALFSLLGVQTPLKNLSLSPLQFSNFALCYIQGKLWFRGISFGTSGPQFWWERWCRLLCGAVLCFREEHWLLRKGCRTLVHRRHSLPCYRRCSGRDLCCLNVDVHQWKLWFLNAFLGQADSPFGGIFPFPAPKRKPGCWFDNSWMPGVQRNEAIS